MIFKNKIALVELKAAGAKKGELDNLSDLNSKIIDSVIETANYLKENLALKDKEVIAAKKKIKLIDVKASSQIAKLNKKALQQISDKESDLKAKISSMKIQEMDKHEIQEAKVAAKTELKDLMIAVKENITLKTKEINEHKKQDTIKAKEELKNVIANTKDEREVINENIKIAKRNIKKVPATAKKEYAAFLKSLKEKYPKVELSEADAKKAGELRERVMSLRQAIHMSVMEVAEKVDIVKNLKKKPTKLSGGQQQRVAIARGIVKKPKILLMDEPLSNLDAKLRISTREWIKSIVRDLGMTTIFVTHDQEEAMSISDKIVCMSNGHVQQVGSPMELYNNPKNKFVAQFLGMPEMKLFSAKVDSKGNISVGKSKIDSKKEFSKKETVTAGIRAEHVIEKKTANSLKAEILSVEYLGKEILAKVKYDGIGEAKIFLSQKSKYEAGEVIDISFPKNKILYFNKNGDRI